MKIKEYSSTTNNRETKQNSKNNIFQDIEVNNTTSEQISVTVIRGIFEKIDYDTVKQVEWYEAVFKPNKSTFRIPQNRSRLQTEITYNLPNNNSKRNSISTLPEQENFSKRRYNENSWSDQNFMESHNYIYNKKVQDIITVSNISEKWLQFCKFGYKHIHKSYEWTQINIDIYVS